MCSGTGQAGQQGMARPMQGGGVMGGGAGPRMGPGSPGWDNANNNQWFNGGGWQNAYKQAGIGQPGMGNPAMRQARMADRAAQAPDTGAPVSPGVMPQYFAPPTGYGPNSPLSAQKRAQEGQMWDSSVGKFDTLENIQARRMGVGNVPTGAAGLLGASAGSGAPDQYGIRQFY